MSVTDGDDAYEALGMPRRAAIDLKWMESVFHALSRTWHPDVNPADEGRFEAANAAYGKLRGVASRLKHLRELEFSGVALERAGAMDAGLMDLFARLGPAMQKAEAVARDAAATKSALAKALMADAIWEARDDLETMGGEVARRLDALGGELEEIDALMDRGERDAAREKMDRCYQAAAFLEKWQAQVREKLMGLLVQLG